MHSRTKKAPTTLIITGNLPQDLVLEILSCLQVQVLWKFRSVCKYWCSLVDSDPAFAKLHLDRAIAGVDNHGSIIYWSRDSSSSFESIYQIKPPLQSEFQPSQTKLALNDDCPLPSGLMLEASCNGLLCFTVYCTRRIILMNPSTRRLKSSPPVECVRDPSSDVFEYDVYGFGYDSTNDDYKVVWINLGRSTLRPPICKWDVRVYSMSKNSWRKVVNGTTPEDVLVIPSRPGIFINGAIHWMTYKPHLNAIISFDVKAEEFRRVLLPPCDNTKSYCYLLIMRKYLGMVRTYTNGDCEVWLMTEYGRRESWTKESVVRLSPELNIRPQYITMISNQILFHFSYGKMVMYDMTGKKTDIDFKAFGVWSVSNISYVESLVSLKSRGPSTA